MNNPPYHAAWNEAHQRVLRYLQTFALGDQVQVARLALRLTDEARLLHQQVPEQDPTSLTMRHAQSELSRWLALNLDEQGQPSSKILTSGYVALLLSGFLQEKPEAFLAPSLAKELRESMQYTLVLTGPDLTVSSMTPRHLDYGPMLDIARQTWHRWDAKSFSTAALFWLGVYWICYWWISEAL